MAKIMKLTYCACPKKTFLEIVFFYFIVLEYLKYLYCSDI